MSNAEYLEKYGIDTSTSPGDSFNRALSDFTHDVASGGAIRHLCDKGYTVSQIMKMLDYPTPRERVEKTFTRHLSESGTLLSYRVLSEYIICLTLCQAVFICSSGNPESGYPSSEPCWSAVCCCTARSCSEE